MKPFTKATVLWALLLMCPAQASNDSAGPSRLTCAVVRGLYHHYAKKGYTIDQMRAYLRAHGISESRAAGAEKCLNG